MKNQTCKECKGKINPKKNLLCPHCGRLPITMDMIDAIAEMANLAVKLNEKINSLRRYFDTLKLPHDDIRNQFLGAISIMTGWLLLQLIIYRDYAKRTDSPISQKILESNLTMSKAQLGETIKNFDMMNRQSYLTGFMFQVEVFLMRISEVLPNVFSGYGYENLVKHVLKELGMIGKDNEKYRIMYFPAIVRNSSHMNGIHTRKLVNGKIGGIAFSFKKGKPVKHAGWLHVYFFCDKMLDIIEEILKNNLVGGTYIQAYNPHPRTY